MSSSQGAWLWLFALVACKPLPEIADDVCGNGVIEDGEDCDTFSPDPSSACLAQGSVGECHWDCRARNDGSRPSCPAGWGCDAAALCRPPSGDYAPALDYAVTRVDSLLAADFDGDGRCDLSSREPLNRLGEATLRFHYFDSELQLDASRELPNLVLSPSLGDIDRDGLPDVLFSDGRLGAALGRADRSWLPETFSSYRLASAHLNIVSIADETIEGVSGYLALTTLDDVPGFYVPDSETGRLVLRGALDAEFEDVLGPAVSGELFEDPSSAPCREVVFGVRGRSQFVIGRACERDKESGQLRWRGEMAFETVSLKPALKLDAPPQIVDVDLDGHLDVLVGAGGAAFVAYGDGSRVHPAVPYHVMAENLRPAANENSDAEGAPQVNPDDEPTPTDLQLGMPLACGDVTQDGALDFVFPDFVATSRRMLDDGPLTYEAAALNTAVPWTQARIADFNGNGALDIVLASARGLNIDFLSGQAGPFLVQSSIFTDAPVFDMSVGDFDGDSIADLAFVEASSQAREPARLSIAFGDYLQTPSPIAVGRVAGPEQLASYGEFGLGHLAVAASVQVGGQRHAALTLFDGTPTRALMAPLELNHFALDQSVEPSLALAMGLGRFRAGEQRDVLVLSTKAKELNAAHWTYWLVPGLASGQPEPKPLHGSLQAGLVPSHVEGLEFGFNVASVSADFDRDGVDEFLLAMPSAAEGCGLVLEALADSAVVHRFPDPLLLPEACPRPQLLAIDVDADSWLDIAIATGPPGKRVLRVLWNHAGEFAAAQSTRVSTKTHSPEAFTWTRGLDTPGHFAYVTANSVELVERVGRSDVSSPRRLARLEAGTGIAAGDFNGDGVDDLAIAASGRLSILAAELSSQ